MDIPIWAEYLEFLSGKKHKKKDAGGEKNLQDKINKVKTLVKSAK